MSSSKSIKELAAVVRQQTEYVEAYMVPRTSEDGAKQSVFDDKFSRFVLNINNKNKTWAKINIRVQEIPELIKKYDVARIVHETMRVTSAAPTGALASRPACNVKIRNGRLRDKTPAEVLLQEGGLKELENQYNWLKQNLEKYPGNKEQMDAIADAVKMYKDGESSSSQQAGSAGSGYTSVLYKTGFKANTHKMSNGVCPVSEAEIRFIGDDNYPVEVTISNYRARVTIDDKGRNNVQPGTKTDVVESRMKLSAQEWSWQLWLMEQTMRDFAATQQGRFKETDVEYARQLALARQVS